MMGSSCSHPRDAGPGGCLQASRNKFVPRTPRQKPRSFSRGVRLDSSNTPPTPHTFIISLNTFMNFRMTKICNLFNWCERTVRSLPDKSGRIEIVESIKEKINNNNWGHEQGAEQTLYRYKNLTPGQHITFKLEETYSFTWNAKHRKKTKNPRN